jgi:hypothetical protein
MRYATFSLTTDLTERLGLVSGDTLLDVHALLGPPSSAVPRTLSELIREGQGSWVRLAARVTEALAHDPPAAAKMNADTVRWHAPIPHPAKNIICLGLNYASHAKESAQARGREVKIPDHPVFFTKSPTSVNGPYDPIPWDPAVTQQVDYETELSSASAAKTSHAPAPSITCSGTQSSMTCRRAICKPVTFSGSKARASTGSARWVRWSSRPTSSAIRRRRRSPCA